MNQLIDVEPQPNTGQRVLRRHTLPGVRTADLRALRIAEPVGQIAQVIADAVAQLRGADVVSGLLRILAHLVQPAVDDL